MEILEAFLNQVQAPVNSFTVMDITFTIVYTFILCMVIAWIYKSTYQGVSYTQSYVHTLIMMGTVVAIIMLIIGSNIARAFSLVGALSIIRFRNAVKDTRDVGYLFYAMAIGMATGTRFYLVALVSTIVISFLLWGLYALNLFAKDVREQILKIRLPSDMRHDSLFNQAFDKYLARSNLIAMETVQAGTQTELIYGVELKKGADTQNFMNDLRRLNNNNKVALITGHHEVDL